MAQITHIESWDQATQIISSNDIVVMDFYADWCAPCRAIAPAYEKLAQQLARPGKIAFTKIDSDQQKDITQHYNVSALPTFLILKKGNEVERIRGANQTKLLDAVRKLAAEAGGSSSGGFGESSKDGASSSGSSFWTGAALPRGYGDITSEVDTRGLDLLNSDTELGNARTLFEGDKPASLGTQKKYEGKADWVESDTDEQLMLFIPFQSTLKIHSLHITSIPQARDDDDEKPMRPKTIKLYTNRAYVLGFEEADDTPVTQEITLKPEDWNKETATAKVELRFVKFQKISSLVLFVVDGEGDGEKTRIDRLRFIGETGEKRAMGELKKIGADE